MEKVRDIERFYESKIERSDLVAAINSINSETKKEFESSLSERLTLKDYVLTFLSNVEIYDNFIYVWKSFSEQPDGDIILKLAHKVIRDQFQKKGEVGMEIRHHLCDRQSSARNA